ncbi:MAG: hypothetical protein R3E79_40105 [Caldilineaceae bacterium]
MDEATLPLIKVVGVSGSGKSTLVQRLRHAGYNARPVSQEHSSIPDLWRQFDQPILLIYLEASLEAQRQRRPDVTWDARYLQTEWERLSHARDHANLKIDTSALPPETVWRIVEVFVKQQRIRHADHPLAPLKATGSAVLATEPVAEAEVAAPKEKRNKKRKRNGA